VGFCTTVKIEYKGGNLRIGDSRAYQSPARPRIGDSGLSGSEGDLEDIASVIGIF